MKRLLASIAAALVVCALAWIGGFDFNERGFDALFVAFYALLAAGLTYICPIWSNHK